MKIKSIETKIVKPNDDLLEIIDESILNPEEESVLVVTSKIVSICEGSIIKVDEIEKEKLIKENSDFYLSGDKNKYGVALTITRDRLIPMAGIDESNGDGNYILWPKNPWKSANEIRAHLRKKFGISKIGVIISDSTVSIMQWGTIGTSIAYAGFEPLKNYIGEKDLFGREMQYSTMSIANGLAAAGVLAMGEGNEQTPMALINDTKMVEFVDQDPTEEEIQKLVIEKEDDLYGYMLSRVDWEE